MQPLSLDDLLPLEEYAAKRREYFDTHCRYLDRYRRVRIGPVAAIVFENRQTLWFRVQEMLRIARLADSRLVQQELDHFNCLLPASTHLQASLLIEIKEEAQLADELAPWTDLTDDQIRLIIGMHVIRGQVLTCRPEDRCIGAAHWVQFAVDDFGRRQLADLRQPARLEIAVPSYKYQSPLLSDEIRQSLGEDLKT